MLLRVVRIPGFAVLKDPLLEGLTNEGVDHVAEVLAGHLANLLHDGQGVDDGAVGESEVQDVVQGQIFVVRDCNHLNVLAEYGL